MLQLDVFPFFWAFTNCCQNVLKNSGECKRGCVDLLQYSTCRRTSCTNMQSQIQIHLQSYHSYHCMHEMRLYAGWLGQARTHSHLKTFSPPWNRIFMLFSQNAKSGECVGSFMFAPPSSSQSSYLSIWLCALADFIPSGREEKGWWLDKALLSWSQEIIQRHRDKQWLIDLNCMRAKENGNTWEIKVNRQCFGKKRGI